MLYQHAQCTTVPEWIKHQDPHAAAECERLEDHACQSAANHDRTGCHKKAPLYTGQTVSVLNNDRIQWLPATVVCAATHGSYIVKVIGGAEYRPVRDHICECHPDAIKPDTRPEVEVAKHPVSTPSAAAKQVVPTAAVKAPIAPTAQPSVAPTTPMQAAAESPTAAAHTQQKTPACVDVKQTGNDVAPHQYVCTIKAPQHLLEQMHIQL